MTAVLNRDRGRRLLESMGIKTSPAVHKRGKYGNQKVVGFGTDGQVVKLDSKREARRWAVLQLKEKAGEIRQLERQIPYTFGEPPIRYSDSNRKLTYKLDFRYVQTADDVWVHEDAKGHRDRVYLIKKALMLHFHNIEVLEV